jgi:branched-chain amino acid transport system ATP-binding protein
MAERLLDVEDLSVAYGGAVALDGVSLEVRRGEVVAVVGANGAGKTTLIRAIAGMVPARGVIRLRGEAVLGLPAAELCERGVAQVPEGRQVFPSLSVQENLWIGGALRRARATRRQELERVYALFPRLAERRGQAAGTLSGGEQQMLAIGRALMARPDFVMLDEPSLGLSPLLTRLMFDTVARLHAEGTTILLVEQNVAESLRLADRAYVLETGRVALAGDAAVLATDARVREAYLGG